MRIGPYDVEAVNTGFFRLDGGGMFGVVPKPLWETRFPADQRNRVRLALRVLLIRGAGRCILVDCGMGDRWGDRERERYAIESPAAMTLENALEVRGESLDSVTDVIISHAHFDHIGGATMEAKGSPRLAFPSARYHIQSRNLFQAAHPTPRDRASFRDDLIEPIRKAGRLAEVTGDGEILPGIFVRETSGHCPGHQVVLVSGAEGSVLFAGDSIPTMSHVSLPWLAAYDLDPIAAMREKAALLGEAAECGSLVVWDHDPICEASRVERAGDGFSATPARLT